MRIKLIATYQVIVRVILIWMSVWKAHKRSWQKPIRWNVMGGLISVFLLCTVFTSGVVLVPLLEDLLNGRPYATRFRIGDDPLRIELAVFAVLFMVVVFVVFILLMMWVLLFKDLMILTEEGILEFRKLQPFLTRWEEIKRGQLIRSDSLIFRATLTQRDIEIALDSFRNPLAALQYIVDRCPHLDFTALEAYGQRE